MIPGKDQGQAMWWSWRSQRSLKSIFMTMMI